MIRRPPRSTQSRSSAASDVYKRQNVTTSLSTSAAASARIPVAPRSSPSSRQRCWPPGRAVAARARPATAWGGRAAGSLAIIGVPPALCGSRAQIRHRDSSPRRAAWTREHPMHPTLVASMLAFVFNGGADTVVWIIGIILIIAGVVSLFRGSVLPGIVLIVIGVLLGGLNVS